MKTAPESIYLVLTNVPDQDVATSIAERLLENKLAACVNVLPPILSVYHWKGKTERASELQLQIKTTAAAYPALEQCIRSLHPSELPEIIAIPLAQGFPAYLEWVQQETGHQ